MSQKKCLPIEPAINLLFNSRGIVFLLSATLFKLSDLKLKSYDLGLNSKEKRVT